LIQYINILTREGKSLLFRNYGSSDVDRDLLAGFLNAFSGFMKEGSQSEIKSTTTDEFKYYNSIIDEIIIVVCTDLEDDETTINSKITTIRVKFMEKFGEILKSCKWTGNRAIFVSFEKEIDDIILGAIKVSIIGMGGSGKSDLIRLICGKEIDLEYIPTINVDLTPFDGEGLDFSRSIILWDFAGQSNFRSLWKSLLGNTDIALLVLDSTFENINYMKDIIRDILDKHYKDVLVIGIAMNQDMPNRLTPQFCERILSGAGIEPPIKVHGMIATNHAYREKILAILRDATNKISNGFKPSYEIKLQTQFNDKASQEFDKTDEPYRIKKVREKEEKIMESKSVSGVIPLDGKTIASSIGKNKKEEKALEATYKHFYEFRQYYSINDLKGAVIGRDILVLTSKSKFQSIIALVYAFVILYVNWFVWFFMPSTINFELSSTVIVYKLFDLEITQLGMWIILIIVMVILDGICVRLIALVLYLRNYFIVLDSQGIYYKKIGKPRFLDWADMSKIIATMKYFKLNPASPTDMVVDIHMKSRGKVRFRSGNYRFNGDLWDIPIFPEYSGTQHFESFAIIFKSFNYRFGYGECPFFYDDMWRNYQKS